MKGSRFLRRLFFVAIFVLPGVAGASRTVLAGGPYEIPARWAEDAAQLQPAGRDFQFRGIHRLPGAGVVVVADRLVLRIDGGKPFVSLGWGDGSHATGPLRGAAVAGQAGSFLVVGERWPFSQRERTTEEERKEYLFRYADGDWRSFDGPQVADVGYAWSFGSLARLASDRLLALVLVYASAPRTEKLDRNSYVPQRREIYDRREGRWSKLDVPLDTGFLPRGMCSDGGVALLLASDGERSGSMTFDGESFGPFRPLPQPADPGHGWAPVRLLCSRDAAWLAGEVLVDPARAAALVGGRRPVLFRSSGTGRGDWQELQAPAKGGAGEDPAGPHYPAIGAMAVDQAGRLWLGYDDPRVRMTQPLYRLEGARWRRFDLPPVPGVSHYKVLGLAFDDKGEGWAIANRWASVRDPRSHGILLRFRDGAWLRQGWTWSPLRQRWFGLLGGLR